MPLTPRCPAASVVDPPASGPSIVCGVLAQDHYEDRDPFGRRETEDWHVFSLADTPSVVLDACCGNFTQCLIWRAEKEREWAEREQLAA